MAGDWIKMRCDLATDPAVIRIGTLTGLDGFAVVGRLHAFWSWADAHTTDGVARGADVPWLSRYLSHAGFAEALISVGWLVVTDDGIAVPNFDRHMGQAAKRRVTETVRKRVYRKKLAAGDKWDSVPNQTGHCPAETGTREEKRREEKKETPPPNPPPEAGGGEGVVRPPRFEEVLRAWNSLGGGLPVVEHVSPRLTTLFGARCMTVLFCQRWRDGIEKVRNSPRCHGASGFVATLEWFLKDSTLAELLNGNYDNPAPGRGDAADADRAAKIAAFKAAQAAGKAKLQGGAA